MSCTQTCRAAAAAEGAAAVVVKLPNAAHGSRAALEQPAAVKTCVNFLKKNEITIPRLPPKATEPTYELIDCENKFLNVVLIP